MFIEKLCSTHDQLKHKEKIAAVENQNKKKKVAKTPRVVKAIDVAVPVAPKYTRSGRLVKQVQRLGD